MLELRTRGLLERLRCRNYGNISHASSVLSKVNVRGSNEMSCTLHSARIVFARGQPDPNDIHPSSVLHRGAKYVGTRGQHIGPEFCVNALRSRTDVLRS